MEHIIIDAKDSIAGRLASYAAKQALIGKKVDIVNCELAIVTGKKKFLIDKYKRKLGRGNVFKGPFISRSPDRLFRRMVRGMLPYKNYRGKIAFKSVMCYNTVPETLKEKKSIILKDAHLSKLSNINYMTIKNLTKLL